MWVRGLKQEITYLEIKNRLSHPMWVRGLKHSIREFKTDKAVAPYVGAWIET